MQHEKTNKQKHSILLLTNINNKLINASEEFTSTQLYTDSQKKNSTLYFIIYNSK